MAEPPFVMLHLGLGSFHRAHQAVYLHRLIAAGDTRWSLAAGNIRPDMPQTIAALQAQGGEYTLETVSPAGERSYERIRSIDEIIPFDPYCARIIEVGAHPCTKIISFTVTEAGYSLDAKGRLDIHCPDLRQDLQHGTQRTIYGIIAEILKERCWQGAGPVTLLSCDNLRSNGLRFRAALLEFLDLRGELELKRWVETNASFPCSMVDRITPLPSPEVAHRVKAETGWNDQAAVMSESFIQWVIEDDFIAGRPPWEEVGVELVDSVHAFEEAKIRILNATHGCVAWAGALRGLEFIHEDVAVPEIRQMALDYVTNDAIPCLDTVDHPSPIDLAAYRDTVLQRFGNPHVRDTNQRVASEGAAKISGFILPTIQDRLARDQSIASVARLPALLLAVLARWHGGRLSFTYRDSLMSPEFVRLVCTASEPVAVFVNERSLWGELAGNERLCAAIAAARRELRAFSEQ